jgi:hypothetical protein
MPYKIVKEKGKFCVVNKDSGENKGCSKSEHEAIAHLRVLYGVDGGMKPTGEKGKPFKVRHGR